MEESGEKALPGYFIERQEQITAFYDGCAETRNSYIEKNRYYYSKMVQLMNFIMEPDKSILHLGSQTGYLLANIAAAKKIGIESSGKLRDIAAKNYPDLVFLQGTADPEAIDGAFDYVLVTNASEMVDPLSTLNNLRQGIAPGGRLILQTYNRLWEPMIWLAAKLGLKFPQPDQNWLSVSELSNILRLAGYDLLKVHRKFLFPFKLPFISYLLNDILGKLPLLNRLCISTVLVCRPIPARQAPETCSVSVIVPCRNEVGNVAAAIKRIPEMGSHTEIIFCDDKSTDGTAEEVLHQMAAHPDRDIKLYPGPGICKAQNVFAGFDQAQCDIVMILDADLTTMPEELPHFFSVLAEGHADFVNGSRLVFPMQGEAMRTFNIVGNKFFSKAFTFILGQPISDTLCGTKVFWRKDWPRIKPLTGTWGVEDKWGDFDLLFSASKLNLKIVDLPVHYVERVSGETKMNKRIANGLRMLAMCWAAWRKLVLAA